MSNDTRRKHNQANLLRVISLVYSTQINNFALINHIVVNDLTRHTNAIKYENVSALAFTNGRLNCHLSLILIIQFSKQNHTIHTIKRKSQT
jgi:hypothetical protein